MKNLLNIENITKEYNVAGKTVVALNNLSLEVNHGDCLAIVGESGSGKTTLARMILGLEYPTAGNIIFDEINITRKRNRKNRKEIQVIQQNPLTSLNPKKKIFSTIALPLKIHKIVENNNIEKKVRELLLSVSLPEELQHRFPSSLSGGQRQRIAIARAILKKPEIMVLDEATSSLDNISEKKVQDAINTISQNTTVVVVAHRLSTIQNADNILVLSGGTVIEEGRHNELLEKRGTYFNLYNIQMSEKTLQN